ncbi:hypothetical protein EMPS_10059 [Entomortierella parvispora]|uniref:Uncharacterized protein n=1 Tax=Entomortierella parvispora TaxID=205924 RepID=A0A9P3HJ75_9FUNG|nr:hypothetical protein EMPS_10059 [Entomortierella parvispora]
MAPSGKREPDARLFVELLLEVFIHECEAMCQEIYPELLTQAFKSFAKVSRQYQNTLSCPCHEFLRKSGLLVWNGFGWANFISSFKPKLLPRIRPPRGTKDDYFGCHIMKAKIAIPTWSPILKHHFRRRYDIFVSEEWKDDIAVFIHHLRVDLAMEGSGGKSCLLMQHRVRGVRKFSSRGVDRRTSSREKLDLFTRELEAIEKIQEAIQEQRDAIKKQKEIVQRQHQETLLKTVQPLSDKQLFLAFFYELVIFELAATYGTHGGVQTGVPVDWIADAFALAAEVLEKNSALMFPCSSIIRSEGLDDRLGILDFVKQHRTPWTRTTDVADDGPLDERNEWARVVESAENKGLLSAEVIPPTLSEKDEGAFLETYDRTVPYTFKDDLAILVYELQNRLSFRGSGGEVSTLHGGLQGVTKFTDMDATMRAVLEQHEEELEKRLKQQEAECLEQEHCQLPSSEPVSEEMLPQDSISGYEGQQRVVAKEEYHLSFEEPIQTTASLEDEPQRVQEEKEEKEEKEKAQNMEVVEENNEPQEQDQESKRCESLRLYFTKEIMRRERENLFDPWKRPFRVYS